jgi:hypothetical protein
MTSLKSRLILLLILALMIFPNGVFAYSYGDPNKEDIAETFKLIVSNLNSSNWAGAEEAYKVRRSEISSHFGEPVAVTLDVNFEARNKAAVIANFQAVLIMNLDRRFTYVLKDINDYSKAKLLLAKGKGTYDVLEPYLGNSVPKEKLKKSFDIALEALGNPGLFGVGEKPINPEVFKKESDFIYQTVKPLFPYKEAKKSSPVVTTPPKKAESKPVTPPKQPVAKPVTKPVTKTTEKTDSTTKTKQTSPKVTNTKPEQPSKKDENKDEDKEVVAKEDENKDEDKEVVAKEDEKKDVVEGKAEEEKVDQTVVVEKTNQNGKDSLTEEQPTEAEKVNEIALDEEHAPMEQTKKTNPIITIVIISGLILAVAGTILFVKKKGII